MVSNATTYLLTGDIGGTNSRMGLYCVGSEKPLVVVTYRNFDHLTKREDGIFQRNVIYPFLKHCWETVPDMPSIESTEIISCLAIAGPVKDNKVCMSNLHDIEISGDAIVEGTYDCGAEGNAFLASIRVCTIINDFVAQGYGCLTLQEDEVIELTPGALQKIDRKGPKACVGAGTGLGECYLTPDVQGHYTCFASEGGHVDWTPRSELELRMLEYLKNRFGGKHRVSVERVVSGTGLANCYEFLAQEFPKDINKAIHKEISEAGDLKGKSIAMGAAKCKLCRMAMESMISSYGSEVGNVAIKLIPTGGLYVTGGLTPKNIKWIEGKDSHFLKAYHDKGRVTPILENIPLLAVMVEDMGVRGARKNAELQYEKYAAQKTPGAGVSFTKNESITAPSTKSESKNLAQLVLALTVGVIAGFALKKK